MYIKADRHCGGAFQMPMLCGTNAYVFKLICIIEVVPERTHMGLAWSGRLC